MFILITELMKHMRSTNTVINYYVIWQSSFFHPYNTFVCKMYVLELKFWGTKFFEVTFAILNDKTLRKILSSYSVDSDKSSQFSFRR